MGGILGGSSSSSQGTSQSSSEQRQALFYPTTTGIRESLIPFRAFNEQAIGGLQPFAMSGTDALSELRLMMGMEPIDPLLESRGNMESILRGINAPAGEISRVSDQLEYSLEDILRAGGQERPVGQALWSSGGAGYGAEHNTQYIRASMQQAMEGLQRVLDSDDPAIREQEYQNVLNRLNQTQLRIEGVKLGHVRSPLPGPAPSARDGFDPNEKPEGGTSTSGVPRENAKVADLIDLQQEVSQLLSTIQSKYTPGGGPQKLTQEQIAQKLQQDPGYQFRFQEGTEAVEKSAAARGGLYSGRAMKELERFGQDLASQQYQQTLANYGSMVGMGYPATQQISALQSGLAGPYMQALQDMTRQWNMSPWTAKSQSSSQQSSSSKSSPGIGGLLSGIGSFLF